MISILFFIGLLLATDIFAQDPVAEADSKIITKWREQLGVYVFSSPDYPAMFAIIGGMSLLLIVGVIYIVVGLFTMEPAKDSIIYRMTTQRMKKD